MAVSVRDRTKPINSTAMRLEPLGARATHVMTFRAVTLDWLEHWRSPLTVNCTEAVSTGKCQMAINTTASDSRRGRSRFSAEWQHVAGAVVRIERLYNESWPLSGRKADCYSEFL